MRNLILAGMVACLPAQASAVTLVCQAEQMVGLHKDGPSWKKVEFPAETFTLRSLKPNEVDGSDNFFDTGSCIQEAARFEASTTVAFFSPL